MKPIPKGCGPRTWDSSAEDIAEKVQPKFDTQKYPFRVQRSSIVHLRYRVESHEHSGTSISPAGQQGVQDPREFAVQSSFDTDSGWKPVRSRDPTPIYPNSPEAFEDERIRKKATPLPHALDLWMSASKLSQYKGIRYLELLKDPSVDGVCVKDMTIEQLKTNLAKLNLKSDSTEENKLKEMWEEADADGNRYLSRDEFKKILPRLLNMRLPDEEVVRIMQDIDKDGSGDTDHNESLDYEEFFAWLQDQDPRILGLVQSHKTELQDRLREGLAIQDRSNAEVGATPGDEIRLQTPGEGGLSGHMTLEFQKFLPVRRATRQDKLQVSDALNKAREQLQDALLKSHKVGRCKKHGEELLNQHTDLEPDELVEKLRTEHKCEWCALAAEQDKIVRDCEEELQELHEARGKLEGVERIMVFRVKSVDAWQKFRPMDVRSDGAAGQVGEKLRDKCIYAGRRQETIGLTDVLDVLVEVVASSMKHRWRYGTSLSSELQPMEEAERIAYARDKHLNMDQIMQAIAADKAKEAELGQSSADALTKAILSHEGRLSELDGDSWLDQRFDDKTAATNRSIIRQQCRSAMKEIANREDDEKKLKEEAQATLSIDATNHVEQLAGARVGQAVGCLVCEQDEEIDVPSHTEVAAFSIEHTVSKLLDLSVAVRADLESLQESSDGVTETQRQRAIQLGAQGSGESMRLKLARLGGATKSYEAQVKELVDAVVLDHREYTRNQLDDLKDDLTGKDGVKALALAAGVYSLAEGETQLDKAYIGADTNGVLDLIAEATGGQCFLKELVPNYKSAHPRCSAVMNRLIKRVQRIDAFFEHTPLLEVTEHTEFELHLPGTVQRRVLCRAINDSVQDVRNSIKKRWQRSNACAKVFIWTLPMLWPLRFLSQWCYFHSRVEDDIEDFLYDKCIKVQYSMPREMAGSLKLQMCEFMSAEHSIQLDDFIYQLQYYSFKTMHPDPNTRWFQLRKARHVLPWLRLTVHHYLARTWLRQVFSSLQIPFRRYYTQIEEVRAMNYMLYKYSDFIDRRRGSLPGESYQSGGVLLDKKVMAVLTQERDDAEQTKAEEEESQREELRKIFIQELKNHAKSGDIAKRTAERLERKDKDIIKLQRRLDDETKRKEEAMKSHKDYERKIKSLTDQVAGLEKQNARLAQDKSEVAAKSQRNQVVSKFQFAAKDSAHKKQTEDAEAAAQKAAEELEDVKRKATEELAAAEARLAETDSAEDSAAQKIQRVERGRQVRARFPGFLRKSAALPTSPSLRTLAPVLAMVQKTTSSTESLATDGPTDGDAVADTDVVELEVEAEASDDELVSLIPTASVASEPDAFHTPTATNGPGEEVKVEEEPVAEPEQEPEPS